MLHVALIGFIFVLHQFLARKAKCSRACTVDLHHAHLKVLLTDIERDGGVKRYQRQCLDANIEKWQLFLEHQTFSTRLVPLTPDDARMLISAYRRTEAGEPPEPRSERDGGNDEALHDALVSRLAEAMEGTDPGECVASSCCRPACANLAAWPSIMVVLWLSAVSS